VNVPDDFCGVSRKDERERERVEESIKQAANSTTYLPSSFFLRILFADEF
jgi:hypothetical protein